MPVARGRRGKHHLPLTSDEAAAFRFTLYKANWLARESRPEASGVVPILAARLSRATLRGVWCLNRLIGKIRDTASRPIISWQFPPDTMSFISMSDAGGVGGGDGALQRHGQVSDATQGALIVVFSGQPLQSGRTSKVSLLSWRSTKLKRKVPSTLTGEALSLRAAISEVKWMQCMYQDIVVAKLSSPDWRRFMLPFGVVLRSRCTLDARQNQAHMIGAKSVFDVLQKEVVEWAHGRTGERHWSWPLSPRLCDPPARQRLAGFPSPACQRAR